MGDDNSGEGGSLIEKLYNVCIEQSECTIYKVHSHLRNVNPTAYEPEIIAIGPYHHGKGDLKMMEDHKLRYLRLFLSNEEENYVENFISAIRPLESKARKSYAEPISLETSKFIEMLVLDGCFIIELVRKHEMRHLRQINDPIFSMDWIINSLQRDLILFENQIPFFVLCKLFDLIEAPGQHPRLAFLLMRFFGDMYPGKVCVVRIIDVNFSYEDDIKHILDLIHRSWRPISFQHPSDSNEENPKKLRFMKRAIFLRETNVKFEVRNEKNINLFELEFKNGTLLMPHLTIEDRTESLFRNLIVFEQYFEKDSISFMTDYVKFLDCLIDSSKDVEILCLYGIIENWLGDGEVVANMVNKLVESVSSSGDRFIYTQIFDTVNEHCCKKWNRNMAKLRRNHANSPWALISIVVAGILLLLTTTQTLFTILQVVL